MAQTTLISLIILHVAPADPSNRERHNPLIGRTKTDHRQQRFYLAVAEPSLQPPKTARCTLPGRNRNSLPKRAILPLMAQWSAAGFGHEKPCRRARRRTLSGLVIDTARVEPVLIEKHGRGVVMVIAVEEYKRLTVRPDARGKTDWRSQGDEEVANKALNRIKIDQILKDTEWRRTDRLSVWHESRSMTVEEPTTCCSIAGAVRSPCHCSGVAPWPHPHFLDPRCKFLPPSGE